MVIKVNLLIPKRNRNERVPVCLHYLNQANRQGRYDVEVYIVDDAEHALDFAPFANLQVNYLVKPYPQDEGFRKAALFNHGLQAARRDFDWFSLIDLDMVYHPGFFKTVEQHIRGVSYVVCEGWGLDAPNSRYVFDHLPDFAEIERFDKQEFTSRSQMSCSRAWYNLYRQVYQTDDLLDEAFQGWGYEDTALDYLSSQLFLKRLATKTILEGQWYHLYHDKVTIPEQQDRNIALAHRFNMESEAKLRAYLQDHTDDPRGQRLLNQAIQAHQQGHLGQAEDLYRQLLTRNPQHAEAYHLLGLLCSQQGHHPEAVEHLQQAIALEGSNHVYHNNLGEVWRKQDRLAEAERSYRRALHIYPYFPEANYNLANVLKTQGRLDEAIAHYQQAVRLKPDYVHAHYNLGNALLEQGRHRAAEAAYRQALQLNPGFAPAHHNLGTALKLQGQPAEAGHSYRQALALAPNFTEAHLSLANLLYEQGQLAGAAQHYRQALRLDPNHSQAHYRLGTVLLDQGQTDEAQVAYQQALRLDPNLAGAHNNLGTILMDRRQYDQAIHHYRKVTRLDPEFSGAHHNLALAFEMQGKIEEAGRIYQHLLTGEPDNALLHFHLATLCPVIPASNAEIDRYRAELSATLERYVAQPLPLDLATLHLHNVCPPFALTYQGRDDRAIKARWAEVFQNSLPRLAEAGFSAKTRLPQGDKPHVGFLVTKGHESIFTRSMEGILNHLPGERFGLTVVCTQSGRRQIAGAITNGAVRFLPIPSRLDQALETIRQARFDLLYYWEIGSDPLNYFLPFFQPAPIQCLSWGTAVTTGLPVDYYLSAELLETPDSQAHYTESLVRFKSLPPYYYRPHIPDQRPAKADYGLKDNQHLYLCAQNLLKVHPDFDPLAAEILRGDPNGVLLFLGSRDPHLSTLLRRRFQATIPDVLARIRFLPRLATADYLGLMALADVSLDTLHYGGANTSYEAFTAGTPVVTLPGPFQRGRYTYALYQQMGLGDCIARSADEYVKMALRLGTDPAYRAEISAQITEASPILFEDMAAVTELVEFFEEALGRGRER